MTAQPSAGFRAPNDEISALVATLHATLQRLEKLTAGEVDTVAGCDGRPYLLTAAQEHLRYMEAAKQAALLNALPAHIALLDPRGVIMSVNEAWLRSACDHPIQGPQFGLGLNYLEVCDDARGSRAPEAHRVAREIRGVLSGRAAKFSLEYACESPTERLWFLLTVTPLADVHPRGVVVMHLDITELKQAQDRVRASDRLLATVQRASEERFQLAVSGSAVGIWEWQEATGQQYLSPCCKEILGYGADESVPTSRAWESLIHADDQDQAHRALQEHYETRAPYEIKYRLRHKTGDYRWYHARGQAAWDRSGQLIRMAGSLLDIHDKTVAEQELVRSNAALAELNLKLAAQNKQLGEMTERAHRFVDDVSHEFRTPLTVIKEFTSIIAGGIGGPVTEQQSDWLRTVDVATVDLNQMVEDFLDSSKLRARLLRIERSPHKVEDLLAGVRRMMARKAEASSVRLIEEIAPDLPAVFADEEKVRRIITNLVSNAIKFSPDGGEIRITARGVASGDVEIAVCDQGPGLSAEDTQLLFERFQQLPSALAPSVKGFGLGLNIARQLVWLNLGTIQLASEPGCGATFSFTLPPNEPGAIVDRFIERLSECGERVSFIAMLRVTPVRPADGIEATRLFLSATTHPSDVVMETADRTALIVCGPTESAEAWMDRLRSAWRRTNAVARPEASAGPEMRILGVWPYPDGAEAARGCWLDHLSESRAHA